jgi:ATP-dependent DNA ligase
MQCKAVTSLPTDEKWTFEIKFDGYRCVAVARTRHHAILAPQEGAD